VEGSRVQILRRAGKREDIEEKAELREVIKRQVKSLDSR
jgi:hypothetical protein